MPRDEENAPIIREPILTKEIEWLDWDIVYKKLVNYIKFAAKSVSQQGNEDAEDLFQEGQLVLYDCFKKYDYKPQNEFEALFKSSLWRKLRTISNRNSLMTVDIDEAFDIGEEDFAIDQIYTDSKLRQVAERLKDAPIALTILKEFINPSNRTIWEAKMDIARKEMLKSQNCRVNIPNSIQIKAQHIQRAMEITKVSFKENLKLVKTCVAEEFGYNPITGQYDEELQDCI